MSEQKEKAIKRKLKKKRYNKENKLPLYIRYYTVASLINSILR